MTTTIEDRIASLEKSNRRLRAMVLGVFLAGAAGVGLGMTHASKVPDVIQAKKFEVVNDDGVRVVGLGSPFGGAGAVELFDKEGRTMVILGSVRSKGTIRTLNGDGDGDPTMVVLGATSGGEGLVTTHNRNGGRVMVSLGANGEGSGAVATYNIDGHPMVSLGANVEGEGEVVTYSGEDDWLVRLGATDEREGQITTYNDDREQLVRITATYKSTYSTPDGSIRPFSANRAYTAAASRNRSTTM